MAFRSGGWIRRGWRAAAGDFAGAVNELGASGKWEKRGGLQKEGKQATSDHKKTVLMPKADSG
jgi:hypothetical protein